ncbi:MAG TPA: AsmA family protein [Orrella sp.]
MRFLLRALLVVVATLLLLLVAVFLLLPTSLGTSFVEDRLRNSVHPQLQINGQVSLSVMPRLGLSLTDVTVPSGQGAYPLVSVSQAQWQLAWLPLLSDRWVFETIYLQGIQVYRSQPTWQPLIDEFDGFQWVHDGRWWPAPSEHSVDSGAWHVVIKQALVEDVSVITGDQIDQPLPVVTLKQAQFTADGRWPVADGSQATFGLRELSVNDADELGHMPALLEQLGISEDNAWDVLALDSQWQMGSDALQLVELQASGPWGEMSAKEGKMDIPSGAMVIPVKAVLTNAPKLKTRGLRVNVRRSTLQFELTGTVSEPGVQWLTPQKTTP